MTFGSLFTGIGGMDLGLEMAGMKCLWQVEINAFCQKLLNKMWPTVIKYRDVTNFKTTVVPDLICGGFPCQPVSLAGLHQGQEDPRWLWPEFLRIIQEIKPRYVLIENVPGLLKNGLEGILNDLAKNGYDAEWDIIGAGYFGAPHLRKRVYILAYSNAIYGKTWLGDEQDRKKTIFSGSNCEMFPIWLQAASEFIGVDDGLSPRFYRECIEGLGNSVVVPVIKWIGRKIIEFDKNVPTS